MERADWAAFFACIDRHDLATIAGNGVNRFLGGGEASAAVFVALCRAQAVPDATVEGLRSGLRRIAESAAALAQAGPPDPATMVQRSLGHRRLVDEYRASLKAALDAVPALARFTAALETALRAGGGGGSVSAKLFVGERLEDVSITGSRAWATRRIPGGAAEDVGFVRRKGEWYIRPLARRRR
jgi:hypothetical protein